jgi:phage gp29-like protein
MSDTINSTLLRWFAELNGLQPCAVSRIIKKAEDTKALSEVDKNVASLGFEPSEKYIQERYGEGWTKKPVPTAPTSAAPASFAETATPAAVPTDFIDPMLAAMQAELGGWKQVIEPMVNPLQKVLDESAAANETAAQLMQRLSTVLSTMDDSELQKWLGKSGYLAHLVGVTT